MNITNKQLKRLRASLIHASNESQVFLLHDAFAVLDELEARRAKENAKQAERTAKKRANDPLYGRSEEYKQKRIAKAKRILELYGNA